MVFPAYNEEPNIETAIRDFRAVTFAGQALVDEIVVVDNNSRDRTGELAAAAGARVIVEPRQGYGNALQRGLAEAGGDLIVLCEPDGTFVARDIVKLLSYAEDFAMVCGTRTTRELIWEEANMGWFLRWGNYAVAKMLEVLYGTASLTDCGCTFRLVRREAAAAIRPDLHVGRSHFLPNMVIAARMNGISMIEIPLSYRGRVGESKITGNLKGVFNTGFAMIAVILGMWPDFIRRRAAARGAP
nr:glycosyltransferase family 2 protein [Magnetospirillum sp. UT-4]